MLLNDSLQDLRGAGSIPHPFRVDDRYRAIQAEPEAVCFGPCNASRTTESEFIQSFLQVVPRGETLVFVTALGFRLIRTNEDMPLDLIDVERSCDLAKFHL